MSADQTTLDSEMHDAFDGILDETLTDPVTGAEVVIDGFDGPATIVLLVPTDFDHPEAEDVEMVDEETKRVRGGEELWGPLVNAAHEFSDAVETQTDDFEDVPVEEDESLVVEVDDEDVEEE